MSRGHLYIMEMTPRTVLINIRVSEQFKAAAEEAARADNRSLTGFIEKLVLDHISSKKSPSKRK